MPRRRYKPEEIVAKLRQVDVLVSQGQNMADAIRQIGVSEVTFYRMPPTGEDMAVRTVIVARQPGSCEPIPNDIRTHRSLYKVAPAYRQVQRIGTIRSHALLGGLHYHYVRV
jgi:NADPH-dependent ferric siderophore reductase